MTHQVFGWRAVIGYIRPSHGLTAEVQLAKAAPPGVIFNSATMLGPVVFSPEGVREMLNEIEKATRMVALSGVDVIIQYGLPIGFSNGIGTDTKIIEVMEKASKVPCTTQITAVVNALRHLGIKKVIIVTGYFRGEVREIFYKFMQDSGFDVVAMEDIKVDWHSSPDTSPFAYYRPGKSLYEKYPEAQGILIAGGNTLMNDVIEPLETDLEIPVITQSSAAMWQVFKMVNVKEKIPGLGRLLNSG